MGVFSAALGMSCEDCHSASDTTWDNYALDTSPQKSHGAPDGADDGVHQSDELRRAPGGDVLHVSSRQRPAQGHAEPRGAVRRLDARRARTTSFARRERGPTADQILDKYIQAIGGAQRLAGLTSFVAKGTSAGYGPEGTRPIEICRQGARPADHDHSHARRRQHHRVRRPLRLDLRRRTSRWPCSALTGSELDGLQARSGAVVSGAGSRKRSASGAPACRPRSTTRRSQVVQGSRPNGTLATFYFDSETGLLMRLVRYANSQGRPPAHADRLLGLPRRGRRQDAVQVQGDLARRPGEHRADGRAAERPRRRGEIRQAGPTYEVTITCHTRHREHRGSV